LLRHFGTFCRHFPRKQDLDFLPIQYLLIRVCRRRQRDAERQRAAQLEGMGVKWWVDPCRRDVTQAAHVCVAPPYVPPHCYTFRSTARQSARQCKGPDTFHVSPAASSAVELREEVALLLLVRSIHLRFVRTLQCQCKSQCARVEKRICAQGTRAGVVDSCTAGMTPRPRWSAAPRLSTIEL
jgi:hypothetical protein